MPRRLSPLRVLFMAARLRLQRLLGREASSFNSPSGLSLSPSYRHFADYDAAPLQLRFSTRTGVSEWQAVARRKLAELAGYERPDVAPQIVAEDRHDIGEGLVRRRVYLRVRAGVDIPVHLVAPAAPAGPRPAMLCLQGTNTGAHRSWGDVRYPSDLEKEAGSYAIALQAARRGYLAVAIEQSCFGEREERQISPRSMAPCVDATMHAILLGRSLIGERCSDVSAVVDWLTENSDGLAVDPGRIHAMGHSAGGSVALFAAALDQRISAVLACGCIGLIRETIGRRRDDQGQNVIPGILNWLELDDIIGLVAPRPFVTVAGEQDHIWPAEGARRVIAGALKVYEAAGVPDRLACVSTAGGHKFRPEVSWAEFDARLRADLSTDFSDARRP